MNYLVGSTGFVGSNILKNMNFDGCFHSTNVTEAFGKNPDLLIYSGVPAQKFLANQNPEADFKVIENAIDNIRAINPKEIVLISTIDVYKNPDNVDEDTVIDTVNLHPYGYNRYYLEEWVKNNIENHLIIHLPALYGINLKKNFIYDLINVIPFMLKEEKFLELVEKDDYIKGYYEKQENGFYKLKEIEEQEKKLLKDYFNKIGFSAINFTDSRAKYQFYNLDYLVKHINIARNNNIKVLNIATEPISSAEVYYALYGKDFINEITDNVPNYNFKTKYDKLFNGKDGYIFNKEFLLNDLKGFINNENNR